jgi:hypothetical protein
MPAFSARMATATYRQLTCSLLPVNAVTHRQLHHALGHDLKAQSDKAAIGMITF